MARTNEAIQFLQIELAKASGPVPRMADGTVVKFAYKPDFKTYNFAAVWVENTKLWYLTGHCPPFNTTMSMGQFIGALAAKEITLQIATAWEAI